MSKTKYSRIVDAGSDNIFAKAFITANGNEELCNSTGRELQEGPDISDHWYEYEDSNGDLHYGRQFAENTYPIMKQNKN